MKYLKIKLSNKEFDKIKLSFKNNYSTTVNILIDEPILLNVLITDNYKLFFENNNSFLLKKVKEN